MCVCVFCRGGGDYMWFSEADMLTKYTSRQTLKSAIEHINSNI